MNESCFKSCWILFQTFTLVYIHSIKIISRITHHHRCLTSPTPTSGCHPRRSDRHCGCRGLQPGQRLLWCAGLQRRARRQGPLFRRGHGLAGEPSGRPHRGLLFCRPSRWPPTGGELLCGWIFWLCGWCSVLWAGHPSPGSCWVWVKQWVCLSLITHGGLRLEVLRRCPSHACVVWCLSAEVRSSEDCLIYVQVYVCLWYVWQCVYLFARFRNKLLSKVCASWSATKPVFWMLLDA